MGKKAWLITIAVLFWVPLAVQAEPRAVSAHSQRQISLTGADPIAEADGLFAYGEDMERDRQALGIIERALETRADEYQLLWRAARVYYHVGDDAEGSEQHDYFARGIAVGQRAIARQPAGV